jgi:hypothetical protein
MREFPEDIFSEPANVDVNTLANLGPLTALAGIWEGVRGFDVNPKAEGPRKQAYVERIELEPDRSADERPSLFYGLRYHTHVVRPRAVETYHDQVGYWLWEPATETPFPRSPSRRRIPWRARGSRRAAQSWTY